MRHPHLARSPVAPLEHNQQLLALISRAVRAATMAPSDREAFNIAGDALMRGADLIKAETNRRSEGTFAR